MRSLAVIAVVLAFGCGGKKKPIASVMRIALGDCAAAKVQWISGPRPAAFTPAEAEGVQDAPAPEPVAQPGESERVSDARKHSREQRLYRAHAAAPAVYEPGRDNPLRGREDDLRECFSKNSRPYGTAIVGIRYDESGTPSEATADGLEVDDARDCVIDLVRGIKRPAGAPAEQRCSIAFGDRPMTEMPALAIAGDKIALTGQPIVDEGGPQLIDALVFAAYRRMIVDENPGKLWGHDPIVVEAPDATPMKLVIRTWQSILLPGDDFVLARKRGADWRLLSSTAWPVVPVPWGTGARWSRVRAGPARNDINLSLLVTKDKIWKGVSRTSAAQAIGRDALAAALAEHKKSPAFVDRRDVQIAGDDVTYGEVLDVVEAAEHAGFTDWALTTRADLAIAPAE